MNAKKIRAKYEQAKALYEFGAKEGAMSVLTEISLERLRSSSLWMRCKVWFIDELYFRRASRLVNRINKEHQKSPPMQAWRLYDAGDYQGALALCNEILKADLDNAHALCTRGFVYRHLGDMERSQADLEKAHRLNPPPIIGQLPLDRGQLPLDRFRC